MIKKTQELLRYLRHYSIAEIDIALHELEATHSEAQKNINNSSLNLVEVHMKPWTTV